MAQYKSEINNFIKKTKIGKHVISAILSAETNHGMFLIIERYNYICHLNMLGHWNVSQAEFKLEKDMHI